MDRTTLAFITVAKAGLCLVLHGMCSRRRSSDWRDRGLLGSGSESESTAAGNGRRWQQVRVQEVGLVLLDAGAAVYRRLLPLPLWLAYVRATTGSMAVLVSAAYLIVKALDCLDSVRSHTRSLRDALKGSLPFGQRASAGEVEAAGGMCAICHDDLDRAVALPCSHAFCGACINRWLAKKASCPVCRAVVPERQGSPARRGETALAVVLF